MIQNTPIFNCSVDLTAQKICNSGARHYTILGDNDVLSDALIRRTSGISAQHNVQEQKPERAGEVCVYLLKEMEDGCIEKGIHSIHIALNPSVFWPFGIRRTDLHSPFKEIEKARLAGRRVEIVGCGNPVYFVCVLMQRICDKSSTLNFFFKDLAQRIVVSKKYLWRLSAIVIYEVHNFDD